MEISNPLPMDRMYTDDGKLVHCKIVDLGTWNMDTTASITFSHGLGSKFKQIISVSFTIRNDADTSYFTIPCGSDGADPYLLQLFLEGITSTVCTIDRRTGSSFDVAAFSSTGFSRGKAFFWYYE